MDSSEAVAQAVCAAVTRAYESLRAELADVPDEALSLARASIHAMTRDFPRPSPQEVADAREAGGSVLQSPPETWVGWSATALVVALLQDRRTR
jgi:hypothetical protein